MANRIVAANEDHLIELEGEMDDLVQFCASVTASLYQLAELFNVISESKDDPSNLALLGRYVSNDLAYTLDQRRAKVINLLERQETPLTAVAA